MNQKTTKLSNAQPITAKSCFCKTSTLINLSNPEIIVMSVKRWSLLIVNSVMKIMKNKQVDSL